ncbi:TetR family transcriptional regulator [Amycolatopsis echigonensis]|uniref:TetR family transcriptional regulator n=1 Tax=Amycolatopsis echigonensis TaxID=2576905 RepID=A0A2N3WJ52_9PSEU|nr:TetR/AcrR family transcriptional regulator [Amycolatopsis niigatensis]PKV93907.1 TetR family transcriptional regulator [Amycolatopsis niigatensis]
MTGLRERKKQATRIALREAALRLAIEHGPANVRVDDIAEAAGVSPRTYNNYFSSREEAIVAAVTADRENRIAAAVAERLPDTRLAEAIIDAITEQYTDPDEQSRDALLLITTNPGLRTAFLDAPAALEDPLQEVIATRVGDQQTARVLAASVAAAVRVALEQWTQPAGNGLVVVSGSLPDLLRRTLEPLTPALDAAEA